MAAASAAILAGAGIVIGARAASAAPAAPVGHYSGTITNGGGRTVDFDLTAAGTIAQFTANTWLYCGGFPASTPWPWDAAPAIPVADDGTWDREWTFTDPADPSIYFQVSEQGVVNADGTASGTNLMELRWSDGSLFCGGETFSWTAQVEGAVYDPEVSVTPASVTVSGLASPGVTVAGSGYPGNTSVTVSLDGTTAGTVTTNASGAFTYTLTRAGVAAGAHTVRATDGTNEAQATLTVTEDPVVYDPEVSVTPASVTVSGLASPGVTVAGSGYPANTSVTVSLDGTTAGTATTNASGAFTYTLTSPGVAPGAHTVRATDGTNEASATLTVTEDPVVYDPEVTLTPSSVTVSGLASPGVTVAGSGYPANTSVTVSLDGTTAGTATTNASGAFTYTLTSPGVAPGAHTVRATDGTNEASATLTVTEDPVVYDPEVSVTPASVTVSGLASPGVTVAGSGYPANTSVTVSLDGTTAGTATTNASGAFTYTLTSPGVAPGAHTVRATDGTNEASATLTVTEDPVVPDPPSVKPEQDTISAGDLAGTGLLFSGEGFPPGAAVIVLLDGAEVGTATANADGAFEYRLVRADVAAGVHVLAAVSGDLRVETEFAVTADEEPTPEPSDTGSPTPSPTSSATSSPTSTSSPTTTPSPTRSGEELASSGADGSGLSVALGVATLAVAAGGALLRARRRRLA
ncbi:hypothetical protein [Salana multivorans]|nr:hypothetical protein [Salana multivorans]